MLVTAGSHFECAAQAVKESEAALNEAVTRTEQSQRENSLLKGSVSSKKQQLEQAMANVDKTMVFFMSLRRRRRDLRIHIYIYI